MSTDTAYVKGRYVVVRITGEDGQELRKAARKLACAEAHTATVGKLADPKVDGDQVTYTWGPITPRGTRTATPAAPVESPLTLLELALAGDDVSAERLRAHLGGKTAAQLGIVTDAPAAPSAFVAERQAKAKAKADAIACKACDDHGLVRLTPRTLKSGGETLTFRTANGAAGALAIGRAKACEARGCKAGKAARKAARAA